MVTTKFRDRAAGPTFGDRSALKWDKEVYSEELLTTIVSVSAVTALQTYLETLQSILAISTSSIQVIQNYLETLAGDINAIDSLTDAKVIIQKFKDRVGGPSFGDRADLTWSKDFEVFIELVSDVGASVSALADIQTFVQSLLTTIISVSTVSDSLVAAGPRELKFFDRPAINEWKNRLNFEWDKYQTFEENLSSVAIGVSSIGDVQNYIGMIATVISSLDTLTDRQAFIETLAASVAHSVSAIADYLVGAMEELLSSVGVSSSSVIDQRKMIDNLLSVAQSLSTLNDKQNYVQNLTSLTSAGATVADLQQYIHTIQDAIVSGSSVDDVMMGPTYEYVLSTIVSRAGVYDYYKKAGMAETAVIFYMAERKDFQMNARPAAFVIEKRF